MAQQFSASAFRQQLRAAQRQAEQQVRQELRKLERQAEDEARNINRHNQQVIADYNRHVNTVNRHNAQVVSDLNKQLAAASQPRRVTYTVREQQLVDRVQEATVHLDDREYDVFLSYARIDGLDVARELRDALTELGVSVWQDELRMQPGKSVARQLDQGLARARAGVAVLTPAYVLGRFWTERELGALLHKDTLVPVLHNVTFADVRKYSGILSDLLGFTTAEDDVPAIAEKIANALFQAETV